MLLTDFRVLENVQILSEGKGDGTMKIRGLFQRADEANQNGRIYPKKILEGQVKALQPMIEGNRLFGELDHPPHEIVKLSNASHMITKLEMKGNDVVGEATLLSTPAGMVAQQIIKSGGQLGISSRGTGSLKPIKEGLNEVGDDYKMITLDLVADPSVAQALPQLAEGKNPEIAKKAMEQVYGEKVFLKLVENSLKGYGNEDVASPLDKLSIKSAKATKAKKRGKNKKLSRAATGRTTEDQGLEDVMEGKDSKKMAMIKKIHRKRERKKIIPPQKKSGTNLHPVLRRRVDRLKKQGSISGDPSGRMEGDGQIQKGPKTARDRSAQKKELEENKILIEGQHVSIDQADNGGWIVSCDSYPAPFSKMVFTSKDKLMAFLKGKLDKK